MKEFTCIVCGAKGIDWGRSHQKKYCSRQCANYHWAMIKGRMGKKYPSCQYNDWVACGGDDCTNCGWNPVVEKMRKELLDERLSTAI